MTETGRRGAPRGGGRSTVEAAPRLPAGTLLARRYLLVEALSRGGGHDVWRAVDQVLVRDVRLLAMPAADPRADALLAAARAAATVHDPHFLRIFDADRTVVDGAVGTLAYVVEEWVPARTLASLLLSAPLPPAHAALVALEVAEAVAAAHAEGLGHGELTPSRVLVTHAGAVRIGGLSTAAVLAGGPRTAPAGPRGRQHADAYRAADVRGLGELLYAGLTARRIGPDGAGDGAGDGVGEGVGDGAALRPAPRAHGRVLAPRQVRPGISRRLDDLVQRCTGDPAMSGPPVASPAEVAAELARFVAAGDARGLPRTTLAEVADAAAASRPPGPVTARSEPVEAAGRVPGDPGGPDRRLAVTPTPRRRRSVVLPVVVVGVLVLAAAALTLQALPTLTGRRGAAADLRTPAGTAGPSFGTATAPPASGAAGDIGGGDVGGDAGPTLPVLASADFDPDGNGAEHPAEVPLATDGNPETAWETQTYFGSRGAELGGKSGVGITLDLGRPRPVSAVSLRLVGTGTALELGGATGSRRPSDISGFRALASVVGAGPDLTLHPGAPVRVRWLVVWLTRLPRLPDGNHRGGIAEVTVRG